MAQGPPGGCGAFSWRRNSKPKVGAESAGGTARTRLGCPQIAGNGNSGQRWSCRPSAHGGCGYLHPGQRHSGRSLAAWTVAPGLFLPPGHLPPTITGQQTNTSYAPPPTSREPSPASHPSPGPRKCPSAQGCGPLSLGGCKGQTLAQALQELVLAGVGGGKALSLSNSGGGITGVKCRLTGGSIHVATFRLRWGDLHGASRLSVCGTPKQRGATVKGGGRNGTEAGAGGAGTLGSLPRPRHRWGSEQCTPGFQPSAGVLLLSLIPGISGMTAGVHLQQVI